MSAGTHGGVMFRVRGELWFLPASIAMKVLPTPMMARVPGGPCELRGVALVDGNMIPIVDLLAEAAVPSSASSLGSQAKPRDPAKPMADAMLVCSVLGEPVGLVGIEVVATGRFEVAPSGDVKLGEETAHVFDVAAVIARVREGRWAV